MANPQAYLLPQQQSFLYPSYRDPLSEQQQQQQPASTSSSPIASVSSSNLAQSSFRAPAHKHAHHLHSIPPREKSTRTLIIDHMLWVHGKIFKSIQREDDPWLINFYLNYTARTRFAQARAELGLTNRTGGPQSPNYIHRTRPELCEEEDEEGSEGEDITPLKARAGGPHSRDDEEIERQKHRDLPLARSLHLRAEGLEKVITSMLEQPPPIHDENMFSRPTSPPPNNGSSTHPHTLPNGVRLRLAVGTIINDLFAHQDPPPPYRHTHPPNSKVITPPDQSHIPSLSDLPDVLTPLAPISGAFSPMSQPTMMPLPSSAFSSNAQAYANNPFSQKSQMLYQNMPPPPRRRPRARSRTRRLYAAGAHSSVPNSAPSSRCPRHLHTGCDICVEPKSPSRQSGNSSSNTHGRTNPFESTRKEASDTWRAMPAGRSGGSGITGWQDGSGIGSGLLLPGVRGSALRRKTRELDSTAGTGNTKLSMLIPRFIRLSALVAAELGREARGEEEEVGDNGRDKLRESSGPANWNIGAPPSPMTPRIQLQTRMYEKALRPSLEWYMLLAGLLTRAVLEGYLTAGWSGLQAIQCLLLVGLGLNSNAGNLEGEEQEAEFADMDPDELPNLVDAVKVLFPALRDGGLSPKGREEEEYEAEMLERLSKVSFSC